MITFVFLDSAKSAVHVCRVNDGNYELSDKAEELAKRIGFNLSDCEWLAGNRVDIITHYGIKVHDEVDE